LNWTTIQLLKKKGVKRYDFVGARLSHIAGSKLEGIQQFKRRFGAELEEGFLWKKDLDIFDCMVFDELVRFSYKLKKQSPLLDIIDEEILKSTVIDSEAFTFTNRLKLKIQDRKNKFLKNYKKYKKEIDKDDLIKNLMASGIKRGDTIMLHSSLSKVGNIKEGAKAVIEALLEWIGPEGNLVMPAYSYINSMENTAKEKEYIFDPLTTPSVVGIITEEFRKRPGVKRSYHPTHSVCAYGPQADYITEGHFYAKTNFGPDTPFHRIRELKGKIVGLGIPIGPVTIYHSVEDFFPEDFPGVYLPKPVLFKMLIESKEIIKSIFIHHSLFHSIRIDKNKTIESWLLLHFKEKHIFHQTDFGSGMMWWMDVQQLYDEQIALRKKEISIYKVPKDGKN
jgi:aminoglycoside 3-N-acetyltransferase